MRRCGKSGSRCAAGLPAALVETTILVRRAGQSADRSAALT